MDINKIIQGDALSILKTLPDESINCVITSPPYYNQRDYGESVQSIWGGDMQCEHEFWEIRVPAKGGTSPDSLVGANRNAQANNRGHPTISNFCSKCRAWKGQLGLEPNFNLYISHLCDIFDEIKRVLRKDGTCWVNIGDCYGGYQGKNNGYPDSKTNAPVPQIKRDKNFAKCLLGVPERFLIEMLNRGWILRNKIVWYKRNVMPSSSRDRFTVDFENIYFFVKSKRYFFETQYEPYLTQENRPLGVVRERKFEYNTLYPQIRKKTKIPKEIADNMGSPRARYHRMPPIGGIKQTDGNFNLTYSGNMPNWKQGRNKRCVWDITTKPFKESHFAVFPEKLCKTPILAGCPEFICNKCGKPREIIMRPTEQYAKLLEGNKINGINQIDFFPRINNKNLPEGRKSGFEKRVTASYEKNGLTDCGCNAGFSSGIILDPFFGSGTTGVVALKLNRNFIGIELNPDYIRIAEIRLKPLLEQRKL